MMSDDEIVRALRCYASDCSNDDACNQCTFAWVCNKLDGSAPEIIADAIESLQVQLAASQRREQAAVKTLTQAASDCGFHPTPCDVKHCVLIPWCEWRGPQEAER